MSLQLVNSQKAKIKDWTSKVCVKGVAVIAKWTVDH